MFCDDLDNKVKINHVNEGRKRTLIRYKVKIQVLAKTVNKQFASQTNELMEILLMCSAPQTDGP